MHIEHRRAAMGKITSVRAYANNEVAYIAWDIDGKIADCLGFEVTRVYLDEHGNVARRPDGSEDRVNCATWVAFKGQRNPHWLPQDTGVWPIQKLSWRDLTLRKKRDGAVRRPAEARVRYEIRPVGALKPGRPPVPDNGREFQTVVKRDAAGRPALGPDGKPVREKVRAYTGKARPLGYLADAVRSNAVHVTTIRGECRSTFTNGILAAQWMRNVLMEDGAIQKDELIRKLEDPKDPHRKYLAGDVLPLLHELFARPGEFFLGLYELEDEELLQLLLDNGKRVRIILSNTSAVDAKWDARNADARKRLIAAGVDVQHRMFNNSTHIGHNKFVVHVDTAGDPIAVLTGSTNWTSTGVAGQTNNALLLENAALAQAFLTYWKRMKADAIAVPTPFSKAMSANQQGAPFRTANATSVSTTNGAGSLTAWFSPNMKDRRKPATKPATPPDLTAVYRLMRQARETILFLAFYPGQRGKDCIIGEVIDIGIKDRSLLVHGAVSSAQAMPNYVPSRKEDGEVVEKGESPSTFDNGNVSIVRAAAIDDRRLLGDFGAEQLAARGNIGAIIHDKLVVIDPRSDDCHVILGSHNLGFKASYSNDENMLIVSGNRALAEAYAVHILDVYDHYRFRAIETERARQGKKGWSGFLRTDDAWQDGYVARTKGAVMRYFAQP
jgi:phosphatidylserine/phosphatidylglycerophosphate/cardiolipin synthase-like enzyme